jgi:hypothetical protein
VPIRIDVRAGDVLDLPADVLAVKFAQHFFGLDLIVATRLGQRRDPVPTPDIGEFALVSGQGLAKAS